MALSLTVLWDVMALNVNTYCPLRYNGIECYHLISPGIQWH